MESYKSLKKLFNVKQSILSDELNSFVLPDDSQKACDIVLKHIEELLDPYGEYRQSLTQSEEYMFLSALNLVNMQQVMVDAINSQISSAPTQISRSCCPKWSNEQKAYILGGNAVLGTAGALIFNSWGAVIGAIAGTAIALYWLEHKNNCSPEEVVSESSQRIDTTALLNILSDIFEKIDCVMETYKTQEKRIQTNYENREQPSLQRDYQSLLNQIANVCKAREKATEEIPSSMQNAIDMLAECLENYNLKYTNGKIVSE